MILSEPMSRSLPRVFSEASRQRGYGGSIMDQAEKLRAIIKQQNQPSDSDTRIITVTSGKGGVGKSSLSINLALQFRREGKRVIIFDADFGLANIEVMFGVIPKYTLADIMFKGRDIKEIITEGPEGVMFVSGGSGIAKLRTWRTL